MFGFGKKEKVKLSEKEEAFRTLRNIGSGVFVIGGFQALLFGLMVYVSEHLREDATLLSSSLLVILAAVVLGWFIFSRQSYIATIILVAFTGLGLLLICLSTLAALYLSEGTPNIVGLLFSAYFFNLAWKGKQAAGKYGKLKETEIRPEIFG